MKSGSKNAGRKIRTGRSRGLCTGKSHAMKGFKILFFLLGLTSFFLPLIVDRQDDRLIVPSAAQAQEDWKSGYEDICGKTQDAMGYSSEELRRLIDRCDKIRPLIEKLDQTQRKVYLRRLQMCRDLFAFALESKEKK